ncbi:MAG TPA: hypothetical protein DIT13_00945 [Verrucomicrobiales bacterium]|nr:hypothetical protein [Verrucomicrobiales bacterium]HRJ11079.1 hypothetical protein [Prosthecobacter sp.]HRK16859.1 hypothetical protein [Prosthecobacter sp.]
MNDSLPRFWLRLLTFRATQDDYASLGPRHALAGLAACWVVGMGRYWDDPRASLLQHLGAGSVVYVFVLSALLWCVVKPLEPLLFSYARVLAFITMTAPPAILYAVPVEKWMTLQEANHMNLRFLLLVAAWRVALWVHNLRVWGRFSPGTLVVAATMPLAVIFWALTSLNLQHVVVNIMGGIREADKSSQDAAWSWLFTMTLLSVPVSVASALAWLLILARDRNN